MLGQFKDVDVGNVDSVLVFYKKIRPHCEVLMRTSDPVLSERYLSRQNILNLIYRKRISLIRNVKQAKLYWDEFFCLQNLSKFSYSLAFYQAKGRAQNQHPWTPNIHSKNTVSSTSKGPLSTLVKAVASVRHPIPLNQTKPMNSMHSFSSRNSELITQGVNNRIITKPLIISSSRKISQPT